MCWLDSCICYLSETVRKQVSLVLMILQLVSLIFAAVSACAAYYLVFGLPETEGLLAGHFYEFYPKFLFANAIVLASFNIIGFKFLVAVLDWRVLHRRSDFYRFYPNYLVITRYLYFNFLLVLAVFALFAMLDLKNNYTQGFDEAIDLYTRNELKRWSVNRVQFNLKCCGTHSFTQWFSKHWVYAHHVFADTLSKEAQSSSWKRSMVLTNQVPFSCCDPAIPRECIYQNVSNSSMHVKYTYYNDVTLFKRGCSVALAESIGQLWTFFLSTYLYLLILFEAIFIILIRYVQTSVRTALSFQDATLTAQGFMCYCGHTLIPSGFKMSPEEMERRSEMMDEMAMQAQEAGKEDYSSYDLSDDDKYWLKKGEQLDQFLNTSLHANTQNHSSHCKQHNNHPHYHYYPNKQTNRLRVDLSKTSTILPPPVPIQSAFTLSSHHYCHNKKDKLRGVGSGSYKDPISKRKKLRRDKHKF